MRHTTQETNYEPLLTIDWDDIERRLQYDRLQAYVDAYPHEVTDPTQHPRYMSAIGALAAHRVRERERQAAAAAAAAGGGT